ncbi:MAG: DUF433 domain-containing protein [Deltaproteobacteria bacterium]|nr:DUF433 domain-containing protein [Deltaproteobacteria bacterium]
MIPCGLPQGYSLNYLIDTLRLAAGLFIDHYPQLTREDIHAALAYAAELSHESIWKTAVPA